MEYDTMSDMNHDSTITVNAFNLEDLHLSQIYQIDRLTHVIEVAKMARDSNNVKQLNSVISLIIDSLNGTVSTIANDHESMTHLLDEAQTMQPVSA